jgi:hypothetical protein
LKSIVKHPRPIWGAYQGNYRRTGVQDSRLLTQPARKVTEADVAGFPNPSSGGYKIESKLAVTLVEVIDLKGKIHVSTPYNNATQILLDLSELNNGLYFIKVQTKGGSVVKRVVIQK